MNNEIKRKTTSIILMTIMLAGGMAIAMPGVTPAQAANPNLTVSSTNFGGPMILEIIVNDQSIKDTNEAKAQPSVTFDGHDLIMAQGDDGSWYAYVAETKMVEQANLAGFNYGNVTAATDIAGTITSASTIDDGVVIYTQGDILGKPRSLVDNSVLGVSLGQIDVNANMWPFIQTVVLSIDSKVDVIYDGSTDQVETLYYTDEMDEFASYTTDRVRYPHNADIHLVIDDSQLNLDPTDEDYWTFDITGGTSYYGETLVEVTAAEQNSLNYDDNGFLDVSTASGVIVLKDNSLSSKIAFSNNQVIVEETLPNSGKFENTNTGNDANLITVDGKIRGETGTIEYNDKKSSILVGFFSGMIDMDKASIDGDWNSGEKITVNITDEDENKNTKSDDDFDVSDAKFSAIPATIIGKPITLDEKSIVKVVPTVATIAQLKLDNVGLNNTLTNIKETLGVEATGSNNATGLYLILVDATKKANDAYDIWQANLLLANIAGENTNSTELQAYQESYEILDGVITRGFGLDDAITSYVGKLKTAQETFDTNAVLISEGTTGTELVMVADPFSKRLIVTIPEGMVGVETLRVEYYDKTIGDLQKFVTGENIHSFINADLSSFGERVKVTLSSGTNSSGFTNSVTLIDGERIVYDVLNSTKINALDTFDAIGKAIPLILKLEFVDITGKPVALTKTGDHAFVIDFMRFAGIDGTVNDAIYRLEAKETSQSSGTYKGTVEYLMLNQINIFDVKTFSNLKTINEDLEIVVHEDLTDEDAVEFIYYDVDGQGIQTQVSSQIDAPTTSGTVTFDQTNYKVADTVTITIYDADLNTNSEILDIYKVISDDTIGIVGNEAGLMFEVTFDDIRWQANDACIDKKGIPQDIGGLASVMNSITETSKDSGVFVGDFQIPTEYCDAFGKVQSVTGNDIEVNYIDFRDASGEKIEVGASSGVGANTGSVSFDRTVYGVPFGQPGESDKSFFPIHETGIGKEDSVATAGFHLENGDLMIHIRVNDPDFDVSASGEDKIAVSADNGPVKIMISRGSDTVVIGTAGAKVANLNGDGLITLGKVVTNSTREYGPIVEIARDAGIFEIDIPIRYTDGPSSITCPVSVPISVEHIERSVDPKDDLIHCILQGDIITVQYTDPTDAGGDSNTVTDSATFDLRNGVLQTDKSVYIIGSDIIMTLIEPDFDLDNDKAESYSLDIIEWDSDAAKITMGKQGGEAAAFDPEPSLFRETGDSTGIFQVVIEVPESLDDDNLERGEQILLEYQDWGPSGADYVGDEDEKVSTTIFTSNFGATVELDQKVYTWTDKVYITIVAPDHNFDSNLIDEIGDTNSDPIKVATREASIDNYRLVETGTDTGIFTGEVILTGFSGHDADGDGTTDDASGITSKDGGGPTDGFLRADDDDGLSVSFEFSENETVIGSSLIRWNIGEVQWLEASYPASGTGVVRIIDPDMNLNPEAVDNYDVDVYSDSDAGGVNLTVTETNEATGIFEGTVFFTVTDASSGHRLRVSEGDTVTANYQDNTLPNPYTKSQELDITATTLIGTIVPPLERAPAANLRIVDAFKNSLDTVSVDQQVQITADLTNGQDRSQEFAYLVQIQDGDGVTVSLAWITGSLTAAQSFSPALSWIPTSSGSYTATAFVWESVDNPTALSPPVTTDINVR